jgi:signal transduction histidine kinase
MERAIRRRRATPATMTGRLMKDTLAEQDPRPANAPAPGRSRDGDLITTANHEIRTPLAVIVGYLEILADTPGAVDPQFRQQLEAVTRSAARLRVAVDDLLRAAC